MKGKVWLCCSGGAGKFLSFYQNFYQSLVCLFGEPWSILSHTLEKQKNFPILANVFLLKIVSLKTEFKRHHVLELLKRNLVDRSIQIFVLNGRLGEADLMIL